jgi:hypothetical protein
MVTVIMGMVTVMMGVVTMMVVVIVRVAVMHDSAPHMDADGSQTGSK